MRRQRIEKFYHKTRISVKDLEGNTSVTYGEAKFFDGEIWPASGKVQAEIYGDRLSYVRNVRIQGKYEIVQDGNGIIHYRYPDGLDIVENDGVCLYVPAESEPDYRILSIKPYQPLRMECMKL